MEIWFLFAILSYLSYAISTSIDKYLMNKNQDIPKISIIKTLLDGILLLLFGIFFLKISFTINLLVWSLGLGFFSSFGWILYYNLLKSGNASQISPLLQSSEILLLFIGSVVIFSDQSSAINYIGVILAVFGSYFVLSNNLKLTSISKILFFLIPLAVIDTIYGLLLKAVLFRAEPINLAILAYFSTTLFLVFFYLTSKKKVSDIAGNVDFKKTFFAALFGSLGTILLFYALKAGIVSKVFPVAGLQSVFVLFISACFLKEKFQLYRLIGVILIFLGIYLVLI